MRVCHCQLDCFSNSSLTHHTPCSLNLGDGDDVTANPVSLPIPVDLKKKSSDEKERGLDGNRVEVLLKSSLKKPGGSSPKEAKKGRVKWMDFVGKELVEIREFEPLQSRDLEEMVNGNPACMCVIL